MVGMTTAHATSWSTLPRPCTRFPTPMLPTPLTCRRGRGRQARRGCSGLHAPRLGPAAGGGAAAVARPRPAGGARRQDCAGKRSAAPAGVSPPPLRCIWHCSATRLLPYFSHAHASPDLTSPQAEVMPSLPTLPLCSRSSPCCATAPRTRRSCRRRRRPRRGPAGAPRPRPPTPRACSRLWKWASARRRRRRRCGG